MKTKEHCDICEGMHNIKKHTDTIMFAEHRGKEQREKEILEIIRGLDGVNYQERWEILILKIKGETK